VNVQFLDGTAALHRSLCISRPHEVFAEHRSGFASKAMGHRSLAEKRKVGRLKMGWLRSEDLKEEEMVTTIPLSRNRT
jgi:hypothetical protein